MPDFVVRLYRSQIDQAAATPPALTRMVARLFFPKRRRWFDPCPSVRPEGWDGLVGPWHRFNYVNPPWNQGAAWVNKALIEMDAHGACSAVLLAARTHTQWFARDVFPKASHICFVTNRVMFQGYDRPCPTACALYVFGGPRTRPVAPPDARLVSKPARMLALRHYPTLNRDAVPAMEAVLGRRFGQRVTFVCVRDRTTEVTSELRKRHLESPAACTVALYSNAVLNSNYVCDTLVPMCSEVWFFTPTMQLDEGSPRVSATGSVAFVLGKLPAWEHRPPAARRVHFLTFGSTCNTVVA